MGLDRLQELMIEAWNARKAGLPEEAEAALKRAVELSPNPDALVALGILLAETGRAEQALTHIRRALDKSRNHPSALTWAAVLLVQLQQPEEAQGFAEAAVRVTGGHPDALEALASAFVGQKRYSEAVGILDRVLLARPENLKVLYSLGAVYGKLLDERAVEVYARAVTTCPSVEGFWLLADQLLAMGLVDAAIDSARKGTELDTKNAGLFALLGRALFDAGRLTEAEEAWGRAEALESPPGEIAFIKGSVNIHNGRFEEGVAWMRQAIDEDPEQAKAYREIFFAKRISENDRKLVDRAGALFSKSAAGDKGRMDLAYGLGKAHDNLGNYETAIGFYDEANRIMHAETFGARRFDARAFERHISKLIRFFTPTMVGRAIALGQPSELPIVVVGVMRSGTTMLDQILSSHPRIGSAGEQPFWLSHDRGVLNFGLGTIDEHRIVALGKEYCKLLAGVAPDADRVVEKNPNNLTAAGLIHMALPNARIIHVRRHPVDNALSIWTTPFSTSSPFVYDREAIVFAHRQLMRLAKHWEKVLPKSRYLEVTYEDLILEREKSIRGVVEFCGLEWNEECLHPENNQRTVRTPSYWQVRQALNASSIGKWKKYEPWLGAFRQLL